MTDLLETVIEAHGGLTRWNQLDGDRNAVGECVRLQLEGAAP
jgi:hypothetical protein